jgi:hypothetical protein
VRRGLGEPGPELRPEIVDLGEKRAQGLLILGGQEGQRLFLAQGGHLGAGRPGC